MDPKNFQHHSKKDLFTSLRYSLAAALYGVIMFIISNDNNLNYKLIVIANIYYIVVDVLYINVI